MISLTERLKQILIRDRLILEDQLEKLLEEQTHTGETLTKILIRRQAITEENLIRALSELLGLPPINLSRIKIDPKVIQLLPKELAKRHQVIPISLLGHTVSLAMVDPVDLFVIDNIKSLTGYTISPMIARAKDMQEAIMKYYFDEHEQTSETFDEIFQDIKDLGEVEWVKESGKERNVIEEITEEAPIIKLTDTIIQQAVASKASDVFIEPLENSVRIRYRIDGVIREVDRLTKILHLPLISRMKVIANLDISEHRLPQDGRFKTIISGNRHVDFRVNVLPTILGEKIVLRVLDQSGSILDINRLGFESHSLERLKECVVKPHGMILTCGPTGSGKTTTLYSVLKYVDSPGKNIVTVEDPVEYQMRGINQVNVKSSVGLTFPVCLRSILRQDPNIIMIGEIRDSETLDIAVKAALTGHLVLSSLHTTTAAGSVVRMVNMGIEPFLICSSVLAIIAQRLLRKICSHCREPFVIPAPVAKKIGLDKLEVFRGKGCKHCFQSGYHGRVGITEILILSTKIKELILAGAGDGKIKETARTEGMKTMREDALLKLKEGLTSLEEVLRVTVDDEEATGR